MAPGWVPSSRDMVRKHFSHLEIPPALLRRLHLCFVVKRVCRGKGSILCWHMKRQWIGTKLVISIVWLTVEAGDREAVLTNSSFPTEASCAFCKAALEALRNSVVRRASRWGRIKENCLSSSQESPLDSSPALPFAKEWVWTLISNQ